jgi:hypothetical protein
MVARKKVAPEVHPGVVRELVLTTTNDGDLYRQQVQPLITNLAKKLAKGVFDRDKAVVAMGYLADNGARKYAWAYGDRGGARSWAQVPLASSGFNAATRRAAAAELLDHYMDEITQEAREFAPKARRAPARSTSRPNGRNAAATLTITANKWRDSYGNTYHKVYISVNDRLVAESGVTYGYGGQFYQTAADLLHGMKMLDNPSRASSHTVAEAARQAGLDLIVEDNGYVERKRDL